MQRIFIKKCFLFTDGSVCRVKRFTTGWQTFRWWRGWNGGAEVAGTTVKRLLHCVFRRTADAMGQVYQCWWRVWREINVSCRLEYHMFHVLCPFVTYLLTLPRTESDGRMTEKWIRTVSHEAVVHPDSSLMGNHKYAGEDTRCSRWYSNRKPLVYKSPALPLNQPARFYSSSEQFPKEVPHHAIT
jgi:hypothetical protein